MTGPLVWFSRQLPAEIRKPRVRGDRLARPRRQGRRNRKRRNGLGSAWLGCEFVVMRTKNVRRFWHGKRSLATGVGIEMKLIAIQALQMLTAMPERTIAIRLTLTPMSLAAVFCALASTPPAAAECPPRYRVEIIQTQDCGPLFGPAPGTATAIVTTVGQQQRLPGRS